MATARADALENLPRQRFRHHAERGGIQHQSGGIGGREPVVEPVDAEIGDRRHVDQDFRDHHQRNREQQQLAGQAERPQPRAPCGGLGRRHARGGALRHGEQGSPVPDPRVTDLFDQVADVAPTAARLPGDSIAIVVVAPCVETTPRQIDEFRTLPYKPRQLSAMARFPGCGRSGLYSAFRARFKRSQASSQAASSDFHDIQFLTASALSDAMSVENGP
ncbi:MAG: hypothetical protein JWR79_1533 [Tardiphaga sp.]|nr:hypothetical protein [Tardiphaga sp.]